MSAAAFVWLEAGGQAGQAWLGLLAPAPERMPAVDAVAMILPPPRALSALVAAIACEACLAAKNTLCR